MQNIRVGHTIYSDKEIISSIFCVFLGNYIKIKILIYTKIQNNIKWFNEEEKEGR